MRNLDSAETLTDLWVDRDLGWLEFNRRVLAEAEDTRTPLLERLKYLAIFTSNLDEFFMKRIAALRVDHERDGDGGQARLPKSLRAAIVGLLEEQRACLARILPEIEGHGVRGLSWNDLSEGQRAEATDFFTHHVSPALTPQVVDAAHPGPFLSNLSLSWACRLRDPGSEDGVLGRGKVASGLAPWLPVREGTRLDQRWFLPIPELIRHHLGHLFSGLETYDHTLFRITRDAEVEWHGESAGESLRDVVAERVRLRRYEPVVRMELGPGRDSTVRSALVSLLDLTNEDVYELPGAFDLSALWTLASLDLPDLRDAPWTPKVPAALRDPHRSMLSTVQSSDLLVH